MDENTLEIIRRIGQQRVDNRLYRVYYHLVKYLQKLVSDTLDELLRLQSESAVDTLQMAGIAHGLRTSIKRMNLTTAKASEAWEELSGGQQGHPDQPQ